MEEYQVRDMIELLRSDLTAEINYVRDDIRRLQQELTDLRRRD